MSKRTKSILLVDDDTDLLENTAFMIKDMGFDVITAENGVEAVEKYKEIQPSLCIMDIKMPKMDGYESFFKIKQHDAQAKIILITAYAPDEKKHLRAKSMGLLGTVNKPYTFDQIEEIITKYT